jgi:very-short-patch-repair endonuclease
LGVGTLNRSQKELLQQLIDEREKENVLLASYLEKWESQSEPFFIKNLESLQGDERDVIFISTTYGPDIERKKVMQRFGPINQESGWRRLNVMLTRSKQKMHVFTSLKSDDIRISNSSSRGIKSFKNLLKFLERGYVLKDEIQIEEEEGSVFAKALAKILNARGIKTAMDIGISGYFIDLAVISENGDALLAIECDGEDYYASKSASDRDRLKDEVLKRLGWKTYRVWSVEWYKNRESEIQKLLELIHELEKR